MPKQLNRPVAISTTTTFHNNKKDHSDEEQLQKNVLLCKGERIMLTMNIWTQTGLVNGALGNITEIVYSPSSKPPDVPMYVIARIDNYTGPVWDPTDPRCIPITPISLGNRRQIPITMAWAITIHKSQGFTLEKATIDIGQTK